MTSEREQELRTVLRAASKADLISAVMELARNYDATAGPKLLNPQQAYAFARTTIGNKRTENLLVMALDAANQIVGAEIVSVGSLNTTRTRPADLLRMPVSVGALGFILAHNHPSGTTDPSEEDKLFTQSIKQAGETLGIELYDHLIVTRNTYVSMRERGML